MSYTVGSLFAGVGGIDLGFQKACYENVGYKILWANEMDDYAATTYRENFTHNLIQGDIERIVKPDRSQNEFEKKEYELKQSEILKDKIDVLVGGFPCQAFSIAGYRKGFDDKRGNLFWSIVKLIELLDKKHSKPSVLFLENVKNLKTHDKGRTYKIIKLKLESLGYTVKEKVINTKDVTLLPQNRERIFIIAFLDESVADNFTLFDDLESYNVIYTEDQRKELIKGILDSSINIKDNHKYYYTKEKQPLYFLTEEEYFNQSEKDRKADRVNIEEQVDEECQFYQIRRGMYIRKNKSGVCPTLTANMGLGGHNVPLIRVADGVRKLTPLETFKLQGFPVGNGYELPKKYNEKDYPDSRLYNQAGNAVTVDVANLIAKEILKALESANKNVNTNNKLLQIN